MSFRSCNKVLEKRWQSVTYEKHRQRLKEMQSKLKSETTVKHDEDVKLQMRLRREIAEGRRQSVIDQQNLKLLSRITTIMTKPRNTYFQPEEQGSQRKDRKTSSSRKQPQSFEKTDTHRYRRGHKAHDKDSSKLPVIPQADPNKVNSCFSDPFGKD